MFILDKHSILFSIAFILEKCSDFIVFFQYSYLSSLQYNKLKHHALTCLKNKQKLYKQKNQAKKLY